MRRPDLLAKYQTDKLVLLGLLVLGVLIARFIVYSRQTRPRRAAAALVRRIKENGLGASMRDQPAGRFFLITNIAGTQVGFTADTFDHSTAGTVRLNSYLYIKGRFGKEQLARFEANDRLDYFAWTIKTLRPLPQAGTRTIIGKNNTAIFTGADRRSSPRKLNLKPNCLPDALVDLFLVRMAKSGTPKVLLDVLQDDGTIIPLRITALPGNEPNQGTRQLGIAVLDGSGMSRRVLLDRQGRLWKVILRKRKKLLYILESTTAQTIAALFPERADYVLGRGEELELEDVF